MLIPLGVRRRSPKVLILLGMRRSPTVLKLFGVRRRSPKVLILLGVRRVTAPLGDWKPINQ